MLVLELSSVLLKNHLFYVATSGLRCNLWALKLMGSEAATHRLNCPVAYGILVP